MFVMWILMVTAKINDDDQSSYRLFQFPEIMYGISLGGSYKNLDISLLFQGATHVSNMAFSSYYAGLLRIYGS